MGNGCSGRKFRKDLSPPKIDTTTLFTDQSENNSHFIAEYTNHNRSSSPYIEGKRRHNMKFSSAKNQDTSNENNNAQSLTTCSSLSSSTSHDVISSISSLNNNNIKTDSCSIKGDHSDKCDDNHQNSNKSDKFQQQQSKQNDSRKISNSAQLSNSSSTTSLTSKKSKLDLLSLELPTHNINSDKKELEYCLNNSLLLVTDTSYPTEEKENLNNNQKHMFYIHSIEAIYDHDSLNLNK
ncbi:unnamed protein product [Didymodactylos carnosus]|uniref:Uncharacterized protein n=1 Tax=Didymodactylos carnosus TaxID=1234261 RepID=A0A813SWL5_9BILA|nr:unnamed protein product [Didymodactylos carnosus]CAF0802927.1 unnamed protein product [Didymodactylos carnosus]CAF3553881.1 unnamed protein product [Didymodactylos carnosus]CAF3588134.1 unnamed protein product [Didymodactylos carnosus]